MNVFVYPLNFRICLAIITIVSVMLTGCDKRPTPIQPSYIKLNAESLLFTEIGEIFYLDAYYGPDEDCDKVTWKSSDESVATISPYNFWGCGVEVTCTGLGKATITATYNGVSATCEIETDPISIKTSLSQELCNFVRIGETETLYASAVPEEAIKEITWQSSDESIVTINPNGLTCNVTCTGFGTATVTVTINGESANCLFNAFKQPVESIYISSSKTIFYEVGESYQVKARVSPEWATDPTLTWHSSNESVATVNNDGLITCTGFGEAIITATADDAIGSTKVKAIEGGYVTDACNRKCRVVKIGTQWWMAENLRCGGRYRTYNCYVYSDCYRDTEPFSTERGNFYTWTEAVRLCPDGWHLPTAEEWETLIAFLSPNAGKKLKSWYDWCYEGNGTDDYYFSAEPVNFHNEFNGYYYGGATRFWTATPSPSYESSAKVVKLSYDSKDVKWESYDKNKGSLVTVRCIKD